MQARKQNQTPKTSVRVLEQPSHQSLTINDIINRVNAELRDPYAAAFVAHIYANLDAAGLFVCSNAEFAAATGMSITTMKDRKSKLTELGFIGYRTSKIGAVYQSVTVYFLPMLGGSSGDLVGLSGDLKAVGKQPKVGREMTKGGSSDDQYIYDDSYDDGVVDDSISNAFSVIAGQVIRAGYNNLRDAEKFEAVPRELLDSWLEQAQSAKNGGALLQHLYGQWVEGGRMVLPAIDSIVGFSDEPPPPSPLPEASGRGNDTPAIGVSNIPMNIPCSVCGRRFGCDCDDTPHPLTPSPTRGDGEQGVNALANNQHAATWGAAYNQLELQLDRVSFDTWLRPATFEGFADGVYTVQVQNHYAKEMLEGRLYRIVRRVLSDIHEDEVEIVFIAPEPSRNFKTAESHQEF